MRFPKSLNNIITLFILKSVCHLSFFFKYEMNKILKKKKNKVYLHK